MPTPFPIAEGEAGADADRASGSGAVEGLGASPGVVEGVVRVVHEPGDSEFLAGEILVCRRTDPGWSAYFMLAAGVVARRKNGCVFHSGRAHDPRARRRLGPHGTLQFGHYRRRIDHL
jgi:phosphoenolpyruvate synthase/pyruvate phosphate dikinase